jgi:preprotein translocase subunit SecD
VRRSLIVPLVVAVVGPLLLLGGVVAAGWSPLLGLDLRGGTEVVLQATEPADGDQMSQAAEVIRNRVDAIGVAEPDITRQGDTIVVQLPGVDDAERARALVGRTAELRFRPVIGAFDPGDPQQVATAREQLTVLSELADAAEGDAGTSPTTTAPGATASSAAPATTPTTVGGSATTAATATTRPTATTGATATTEAAATGDDEAPSIEDVITPVDQIENDRPIIAVDNLGSVGYVLAPAEATGDIVGGASADFTNSWFVIVDFTDAGNDEFNRLAGQYVGQQVAVELDGTVYSAPTIQATEFDGQATITGTFTEQEAKDLALILRFGALPLELSEISARNVSPTLGENALDAGLLAGAIGLVLVGGYMILYYRLLGVVAVIGLIVAAALLYSMIAWLGETRGLAITLAGMTGLVVSIGIQVDSNVVYYESVKEEVRRGRSVRAAAEGGFGGAFSTILKADIASLIGAGLLYYLSVGSVRGFALFLGLATLSDLLISLVVMRPAVIWLARSRFARKPSHLGLVLPDPEPVPQRQEVGV